LNESESSWDRGRRVRREKGEARHGVVPRKWKPNQMNNCHLLCSAPHTGMQGWQGWLHYHYSNKLRLRFDRPRCVCLFVCLFAYVGVMWLKKAIKWGACIKLLIVYALRVEMKLRARHGQGENMRFSDFNPCSRVTHYSFNYFFSSLSRANFQLLTFKGSTVAGLHPRLHLQPHLEALVDLALLFLCLSVNCLGPGP